LGNGILGILWRWNGIDEAKERGVMIVERKPEWRKQSLWERERLLPNAQE